MAMDKGHKMLKIRKKESIIVCRLKEKHQGKLKKKGKILRVRQKITSAWALWKALRRMIEKMKKRRSEY